MSFESNLKSIAESMKSIAGSLELIAYVANSGPSHDPKPAVVNMTVNPTPANTFKEAEVTPPWVPEGEAIPTDRTPAPTITVEVDPDPDPGTAGPYITIQEANDTLVKAAMTLNDQGAAVRSIMGSYGAGQLSDVATDQVKLQAIIADVQNLLLDRAAL